MHVHVATSDGEAKFWMEPEIALASSYGLPDQIVNRALELITEGQQEIRDARRKHFPDA